ncbi:MAG: DUF2950 domain-containing protein [Sulfurimicrobium sp.]|nr:DUF2950 domain-containing protein [Sulfurimicrobium sp.]
MNKRMLTAIAAAVAMTLGALPAVAADAQAKQDTAAQAKLAQASYASPEEAAKALYEIVKMHDVKSIYRVLGPGSGPLIYTGDKVADQQMRERFLAAYDKSLKIEWVGDAKATLLIGVNESPFPFPMVKSAPGWRFDAKAGAEEIVNRRIGENELFAIEFCLAYGDAQREYAEQDRDGDGVLEYAQKFRSSEGKRDGLYWPTAEGEPASPLGPLAARAKREGYSAKDMRQVPFHGYYYRILTSQGNDNPGRAHDYIVNGNMIGGYALVAYPARWGASGVMTFIYNYDGVVYQKNLGAGTASIASKMTRFNPDASWSKAK